MNITLDPKEALDLACSMHCDIRERFSRRHCWRRPVGSLPAMPEKTAEQYQQIRTLIAIFRKVELSRERDMDRIYRRRRCRDMADLRRRNAIYATRKRIQRDAQALHFTPLQKAA